MKTNKRNESTMQKLDQDQLAQTVGGMDSCTYAGVSYSHGARLEQAGTLMECVNGSWAEVAK